MQPHRSRLDGLQRPDSQRELAHEGMEYEAPVPPLDEQRASEQVVDRLGRSIDPKRRAQLGGERLEERNDANSTREQAQARLQKLPRRDTRKPCLPAAAAPRPC